MNKEQAHAYNLDVLEERTKIEEAAFALFRIGRYEESKELLSTLSKKAYVEQEKQQELGELPKMLTIKEASDKTGLSYNHIRQMCLSGRLVYVKAGSKFLINSSRLMEYLNNGEGVTA